LYNGAVPTNRETAPVMLLLLSDTQLCNQGTITLNVLIHKVVKQTAALTDHLIKSHAAVVVLFVDSQVLSNLIDTLGENSNLNLG